MPGGTTKQKVTSRPILPPITQPIAAAPLHISSTGAGPVVKAQHSRLHAFAPPIVRTVTIPLNDTEAGPSRREPSPKKDFAPAVSVSILSSNAQSTRPPFSKTLAAEPVRPSESPFPLGHCGRSVSHDVLTMTTIHTFGPSSSNETTTHNPLSRPSRPHLPSSFSSVSLPADQSESIQLAPPPRRFAPPTRIVRPTPLPEESLSKDESMDYFSHVPSGAINLSGPQRLPVAGQGERWVAVGFGKRPTVLGQAHRRAVTAPGGVLDGLKISVQTPSLASLVLRRSMKEYPNEIENDVLPMQISSSDETDVPTSTSPTHMAPTRVDSPLLPVMVRSTTIDTTASSDSSKTAAEEMAEDMTKMEDEAADSTELEVEIGKIAHTVEVLVVDASDNHGEFEADSASESAIPEDTIWRSIDDRLKPESRPGIAITQSPAYSKIDSDVVSVERPKQVDTEEIPTITPSIAEPLPALISSGFPVAPQSTAIIQSTQAAQSQLLPDQPFEPRKTASTAERRAVSGSKDWKPFKPTIRPAAGSTVPAKQTYGGLAKHKNLSTNVTQAAAPYPSASTKPAIATASASTSAQIASSTSYDPPKLVSKSNIKSAAGATKPTASSIAKAAAKQENIAPPFKLSLQATKTAHAQVTLPPVRKERVRLKPPLPSFVPTRGKGKAAMGALTSSTTGKLIVDKSANIGKVRPENIPLPVSPAEKVKLAPDHVPLPDSPIATESHDLGAPGRRSPLKPVVGMSPCTVVPSKPLSPILNTTPSLPTQNSPIIQMAKLIQVSSPEPHFVSLTIDHSNTASSPSASRRGLRSPSRFPDTRNELQPNGECETPRQPWSRNFLLGHMIDRNDLTGLSTSPRSAQASRSDVVSPAKSAQVSLAKMSGSTTPIGTPRSGRTPLSLRDANQS